MAESEFSSSEEDRWIAIDLALQGFLYTLSKKINSDYDIGYDEAVLYDVLVSAYHDIARYKDWHQKDWHQDEPVEQKSDSIKRAAYFTKWLVRLRPIWMSRHEYHPERHDRTVLLNERFAIEWAFANLDFEVGRQCPIPTRKKLFDLLYDLHYRNISDDALIHIYQIYYDLAMGDPIYIDLNKV